MGSLKFGVPEGPDGTLYVLAADGGVSATPRQGFEVVFGRQKPDVHVCVGPRDPYISRRHGRFLCYGSEWWLRNEGKLPIQLPGPKDLLSGQETPIRQGYSPLFISSSSRREHLVEVCVLGATAGAMGSSGPFDSTWSRTPWPLDDDERLVLTALSQRYLRQDDYPQPLAWGHITDELNELAGYEAWTTKTTANLVADVRARLSRKGVRGLTREEVGEPLGNMLNHNLILELVRTASLVPSDLRLLDADD